MPSRRLWLWLLGLTLVSVAYLWWTRLPLGVPGEWQWDRVPVHGTNVAQHVWELLLTSGVAVAYLTLVGLGAKRIASSSKFGVAAWLLALLCGAFAWLWTVQEYAATPVRLSKAAWVLYYPGASGYFTVARYEAQDAASLLRSYELRMREGDVLHVGTHPPGLFVLYRGLIGVCEWSPTIRDWLLATAPDSYRDAANLISRNSLHSRMPFLEADHAVLWLAALITQWSAVLTMLPLYALIRGGFSRRTGWLTTSLWPFLPALSVFLPKSDVLYPFVAMSFVWACCEGWNRRSGGLLLLAGALLWGGLFLSLAFLPVAVFAVLVISCLVVASSPLSRVSVRPKTPDESQENVIPSGTLPIEAAKEFDGRLGGTRWRGQMPSVARLVAWGVLGMLAPIVLCHFFWDLNCIEVWSLNFGNHARFYEQYARTYWKWLAVNPIELAFAVGAPVAVLACSGLIHSLRKPGRSIVAQPAGRVALSTGVVLGLLWVSGKNMGELARLWILFLPWIVWLAADSIDRLRDGPKGDSLGRAEWMVLAVQAFVCVATVCRVDGFHLAQLMLPGTQ